MLQQPGDFLTQSLPTFEVEHQNYLPVGIGYAGGCQSLVYIVNQLVAVLWDHGRPVQWRH